jgi:hypothetical protein
MALGFEKLVVYQKAVDFADAICTATEQFPRGYGYLIDQLNRAALSIAANIAKAMAGSPNPTGRTFSASLAVQSRSVSLCWKWPDAVVFSRTKGTPASNRSWKRFCGCCPG